MTEPANADGEHACDTPDAGLPGDEWTCPVCGRVWWADDVESDDAVLITWRPVVRCTCPRDPDDAIDPGDPLSTCPIHGWRS